MAHEPGSTSRFFENLQAYTDFSEFTNPQRYRPLPDDWYVIITDVKNSTKAIDEGAYKQVNAMGVASIVAIINAVKPVHVPYVFGGDGVTVCIPGSTYEQVKPALLAANQLARERFDLVLRTGAVSITEIRQQGLDVLVSKYSPNSHYDQAMFLGDGVDYAEKLIKSTAADNPYLIQGKHELDNSIFSGFECRWNEIPSPCDENISLIVKVREADSARANAIYRAIIEEIREIYGEGKQHHPLTKKNLSLTSSLRLLAVEAGIRTAFKPNWERIKYLASLQFYRLVGIWFMYRKVQTRTSNWGQYKDNLIANTDYRKFDQALRMVISGSGSQRQQLRSRLEERRKNDEIVFGLHASPASLITCIVTDYDQAHVHFLDGANGGYAMASRELKQQLAAA